MSNPADLRETLKSMLALLEGERDALASFDMDRILTCAEGKMELCDRIERATGGRVDPGRVDEECHGLLDAVRRLNAINRKLRNLIAANVQGRLNALTGAASIYGTRAQLRGIGA